RLSIREHVIVATFWLASNFQWGALLTVMMAGDVGMLAGASKAAKLGMILGAGAIPAIVIPLIAGVLSDRCLHPKGRRKPYILWGAVINFVGIIAMGISAYHLKNLNAYFFSFLVVQIGANTALGAYMGVIPDVVPKIDQDRASGFMALFTQMGTLLGAAIVGMVLGGGFISYIVLGSVVLAGALITYFFMKEEPQTHCEKIDWQGYVKSLWIDPKTYPNYAWVWFTRFLVMAGFYAILPFVNYYLVDIAKVPQADISAKAPMLLGIILIVSAISGICGGILAEKHGRKKVVYIANGIITVVAPMFAFAPNLPAALGVGALFGLGYGAYISVDYALGTAVLPSAEDAGKDMAVWHIAMTLPQSIAAPIGGFLVGIGGAKVVSAEEVHYSQTGYILVFLFCSVCFAFGAILLRNVKGIR
ncbi:MAG TPA: MFS transporter, partial [Fimbriimonas sp.]|nr:MFS transporter [Fimbriimonas sp.]